MANHQRKGATSNAAVGNAFEVVALNFFVKIYPNLKRHYKLPIGHHIVKPHEFDLGCSNSEVIAEVKSHTWTESGNVPSAKMTTWDQAMLYFYLAPRRYKKLFVVKKDLRNTNGESLAKYYLRTKHHLIPDEVQIWELDEATGKAVQLTFDPVLGSQKL